MQSGYDPIEGWTLRYPVWDGGGGGEILMEFIQAFEEWKQILQLNRKTERKIPAQLLHCENKFDKASNLKKFLQRKFSLSLI